MKQQLPRRNVGLPSRILNRMSWLANTSWREGALLLALTSTLAAFSSNVESANLALHATYSFTPAATYQYTRDPRDTSKLTDGAFADGFFWTSRKATMGWVLSGPISVEIDLGATSAINRVCVNTARSSKADVSFPERIDVFLSNDQQTYTYVGDILNNQDHSDGDYFVKRFCGQANDAGRYALIVLTPRGRYAFTDEIEVIGKRDRSLEANTLVYPIARSNLREFQSNLFKQGVRTRSQKWMARQLLDTTTQAGIRDSEIEKLRGQLREFISTTPSKLDTLSPAANERMLFNLHQKIISRQFPDSFLLWHKDPWTIQTPLDTPTSYIASNTSARIDLARNGSGSEAYVLTNSTKEPVTLEVSTRINALQNPAIRFLIREVLPILLADNTLRGDPLIELSHDKITVLPGESKQLWITIFADNADPGQYSGEIHLSPITKQNSSQSITLDIRVWPFSLPTKPNVHTVTWSYLNWRPIADMPAEAVRDLTEHHTNTFVLHPSEVPWPKFTTLGGTSFTVNFDKFDRFVQYHKDVHKSLLFFMHFNDDRIRSFDGNVIFMSLEWKAVFLKWLNMWVSHATALGLTLDQFALYPIDEPRTVAEASILIDTATLIKTVDPRLQVYTTIGTLSSGDLLRAVKFVDIFQVLTSDLPNPSVDILRGLGKSVWTYTAEGGGKAASPISFYRMQAWKAFQRGLDGIGFWAYADTGRSGSGWDDLDDLRPDFAVIYESKHMIVSSKRWEAWREGVEDFELLIKAKASIRSQAEKSMLTEIVDATIANPDDHPRFQSNRRWLLQIASR
ncbi:MAG: hypothetical protein Q8N04_09885 [Nitrospira sp.]|nr:hypothetical protein [Nitrospira sp.]